MSGLIRRPQNLDLASLIDNLLLFLSSAALEAKSELRISGTPEGALLIHIPGDIDLGLSSQEDTPFLSSLASVSKELAALLVFSKRSSISYNGLRRAYAYGRLTDETELAAPGFRIWAEPNPHNFKDQLDAYPFRIRIQELAALRKGLKITSSYMGYPPVSFKSGELS